MLHARSFFAAATGPDGHIYAISGNSPEVNTSVEAYVPQQNRWVRGPAVPTNHAFGGAARGPDGRLYVIGGSNGDEGEPEVDAYDIRTRRWTHVTDLPTPRGWLAVAAGPDGRIYALGGMGGTPGSWTDLATVEAYNVWTKQWVRLADLPSARQDLAAASGADGRIYAVGGTPYGVGDSPGPSSADVDAYDPHTNRWQVVSPLATARQDLAAARGADGRIYALGGYGPIAPGASGPDVVLATVEAYGPVIHLLPPRAAAGSTTALTGTNFAARATVRVTWGSAPGRQLLGTGQTDAAGNLLHPITIVVPRDTGAGPYTITAEDDRSRYPVMATWTPTARLPTPAAPVPAACRGARYFPQTHHTMGGAFLAFYQRYGGLDTFGYPRTEPFTETGHLKQYTDRFLLELEGGQVRTAPLGRLLTAGRTFAPVAAFLSTPDRMYFASTRHGLSGRFLAFWRSHHGAAPLGAPFAEPTHETNGDGSGRVYLVQWFENGRLEYHPELTGTRYVVQIGLSGKQALQRRCWL
jgi:hypothetical protein